LGIAAGLAHLLPQADRRVRVVAGARRQLQADDVRLVLVGTAVGQSHQVFHSGIGHLLAGLAQPQQGRAHLGRQLRAIGLGHGLAAVLAKGVGDFVAHYRRQLGIGQLQLLDQATVDDDLAARAAVGVELFAVDQVDLPVPLRGIGTEHRGLGDQSAGDGLDPPRISAALVQHTLARGLAEGLLVSLGIHAIDLLGGQHAEHVLLALHAHRAAAGGIHGLAGRQQGKAGQGSQAKQAVHIESPGDTGAVC
jgi:hypothetical protein